MASAVCDLWTAGGGTITSSGAEKTDTGAV